MHCGERLMQRERRSQNVSGNYVNEKHRPLRKQPRRNLISRIKRTISVLIRS